MTLSTEEKVNVIKGFLLSSPPGELNDVLNDVRFLLDNDEVLQGQVIPIFQQYNEEQFTVANLPQSEQKSLITPFNRLSDSSYFDDQSKLEFTFDHLKQECISSSPRNVVGHNEATRSSIEKNVTLYVAEHYPNGVSCVFSQKDGSYAIVIVGNKYNPQNFWNGRWRSSWTYNPSTQEVSAVLKVQVHYYEDGNVQLNEGREVTFNVPSGGDLGENLVKEIKRVEQEFHGAINDNYTQLNEATFKSLRRALPVTKTKIDWGKIMSYKLGSELGPK